MVGKPCHRFGFAGKPEILSWQSKLLKQEQGLYMKFVENEFTRIEFPTTRAWVENKSYYIYLYFIYIIIIWLNEI